LINNGGHHIGCTVCGEPKEVRLTVSMTRARQGGDYNCSTNGELKILCSQDKDLTDVPDVVSAATRMRMNRRRKPGETIGVNV
jgi:hypothetical protein